MTITLNKAFPFIWAVGVVLVAASSAMRADIVVTAEPPGVQATAVAGTTTMDFDAVAPGFYAALPSPIGAYSSPGLSVQSPNDLGGANQTQFLAVGAQSGQLAATLSLNSPMAYLGVYWEAADSSNILDFFLGNAPLASFQVSTVIPLLQHTGGPFGTGYFGNPNTNQNTVEPYVYLNFIGTDGETFDKVVFRTTDTSAGFESDNHSARVAPLDAPFPGTEVANLPRVIVPEPAAWVLGAVALAWLFSNQRVDLGRKSAKS